MKPEQSRQAKDGHPRLASLLQFSAVATCVRLVRMLAHAGADRSEKRRRDSPAANGNVGWQAVVRSYQYEGTRGGTKPPFSDLVHWFYESPWDDGKDQRSRLSAPPTVEFPTLGLDLASRFSYGFGRHWCPLVVPRHQPWAGALLRAKPDHSRKAAGPLRPIAS